MFLICSVKVSVSKQNNNFNQGIIMKLTITLTGFILILSSCSQEKVSVDSKPSQGDYWAVRYGYPTMQVDPAWFVEGRKQHEKVLAKIPSMTHSSRSAISDLSTFSFTALGPKPLNTFGGSSFAGRVNVIVSHPTDSQIAYLGVDGGGVWKTSNCCDVNTTWTNVTDNSAVVGGAIGDLYLDPNNPDIIYAGTGDLRYGSYSFGSAGLLRSKNGGITWEILGESEFSPYRNQAPGEFPQYQAIGKVRSNPLDSTQIVVGTKTGLFFSYDDGLNWTGPCLTNAFTDQRQDITGIEVAATGDIYAAVGTRGHPTTVQPDLGLNGANGIYKTSFPASGCPTWSLVTHSGNGWPTGTGSGTPFPTNSLGRIDITMAPSDNDVLYAQIANISTREVLGVWKTTDGGTQWTQTATTSDIGGCDDGGTQAWYDMGMAVSPNDSDIVFLSAVDLFKSSNGGDTFVNSTCGYSSGSLGDFVHVDHHARTFVANDPTKLLLGSDGGVYYTGNADEANPRDISYTQLNDSINAIEFYSGDISADFATATTKIAVGGAQDNGSSVSVWEAPNPLQAQAWTRVNGGDGIYATIEPIQSQRVYVESQYGNMRISTTGPLGSYFNFVSPWSGDSRVPFIFPFHLNKHDCPAATCDQLMAGTYRIWETNNGGLNNADWYVNSPDLTKGVLNDRSIINQMHYDMEDGTVAIVGTNDGNVYYGFNMGQGTNTANWVDVTDSNSTLPNRPILDVVSYQMTGYAAVGGFDQNTPTTPGHLYQISCDANCQNFQWADKSGNLPNIPVNSVMINPLYPDMVFAGTDWGLYYTQNINDMTPDWFRFNTGIPSVMIWDLTIDRGFTTLAAFTRTRGAYVWPLPDTELSDLIFENGFE